MCRFVAFLWNHGDLSAQELASTMSRALLGRQRQWSCAASSATMKVFHNLQNNGISHTLVLPDSGGVIFGKLFQASQGTAPVTNIPPRLAREIVASDGRELLSQFWGSYIAIVSNEHSRRHSVLRDCTGAIPCFRVREETLDIFFSDTSDLRTLIPRPLAINWRYLATYLVDSDARLRETGLAAVHELLAGDCWSRSPSSESQRSIWNPAHVWKDGAIDDYEVALAELRDSTQRCIDSWSTVHRRVILRLSGGLDSGIVLGCIGQTRAPPNVTCLNRYDDEPGGDERYYARLAARKHGVALVEHPWSPGPVLFDEQLFTAPQFPKPVVESIMHHDLTFHNDLAKRLRTNVTWTGQGGDHLFLQPGNELYAADYLRVRGLRRGFPAAVRDAARLTGSTYWSVLTTAILGATSLRNVPATSPLLVDASFVRPDAIPEDLAARLEPPWLAEASGLPPGKRFQASILSGLVNRLAPIAPQELAPEHHPLISQPLLETCIRIPTYLLTTGGISRGLARKAFERCLPDQILCRRGKGETTQFTVSLIRNNARFLQELLLDGILVRERLVARADIAQHVSGERPLGTMQLFPMLACVTAELWARSWSVQTHCHTAQESREASF